MSANFNDRLKIEASEKIRSWLEKPRSRAVNIGRGQQVKAPRKDEGISPDELDDIAGQGFELWLSEFGTDRWAKSKGVPDARVCAGRALATWRTKAKNRLVQVGSDEHDASADPRADDAIDDLIDKGQSRHRTVTINLEGLGPLREVPTLQEQELMEELWFLEAAWTRAYNTGQLSKHAEDVYQVLLLAAHAPTAESVKKKKQLRSEYEKLNKALRTSATTARTAMERLRMGPRSLRQCAEELVFCIKAGSILRPEETAERIVGSLWVWRTLTNKLRLSPVPLQVRSPELVSQAERVAYEAVLKALQESSERDPVNTAKAVVLALGYPDNVHDLFDFIRKRERPRK